MNFGPPEIINESGRSGIQYCRLCFISLSFVAVTGYGSVAHFCHNPRCAAFGLHTSVAVYQVNSTDNLKAPDSQKEEPKAK